MKKEKPKTISEVVTCSGRESSGTLRFVRLGVGSVEQASVPCPGVREMWTLRRTFGATNAFALVQSSTGGTRSEPAVPSKNWQHFAYFLYHVCIPYLSKTQRSLISFNVIDQELWVPRWNFLFTLIKILYSLISIIKCLLHHVIYSTG